jgi:hypothetical protein
MESEGLYEFKNITSAIRCSVSLAQRTARNRHLSEKGTRLQADLLSKHEINFKREK